MTPMLWYAEFVMLNLICVHMDINHVSHGTDSALNFEIFIITDYFKFLWILKNGKHFKISIWSWEHQNNWYRNSEFQTGIRFIWKVQTLNFRTPIRNILIPIALMDQILKNNDQRRRPKWLLTMVPNRENKTAGQSR